MCGSVSLLTNLIRVPGAIVTVEGLAPAEVMVMTTVAGGGGGGGAGAVSVNPPASRPLRPSVFVTTTSTLPAAGGDGWEEGPAGLEPPHEGPNTVSIATAI